MSRKLRKQPSGQRSATMRPGDRGFSPQPPLECAWISDLIVLADGSWKWRIVKKHGIPRGAEWRGDAWYWMD